MVYSRTGYDFSSYKTATLNRRIARRMQVNDVSDLDTYARNVRISAEETRELMRSFLISVTNFFRDPESFATLQNKVLPRLFAEKDAHDEVRVWVPGCATGEEAYSIAILLHEHAEKVGRGTRFHVFATDIDEDALVAARRGRYPLAIRDNVSEERLARYFEFADGGYRVRSVLRERIVFASHDVLKDPPFSRLDLVSCRNLLIYLDRDTQRRVVQTFYYATRPASWLMLGTSETVDSVPMLFAPTYQRSRLFRRIPGMDRMLPPMRSRARATLGFGQPSPPVHTPENLVEAYHERTLSTLAPPRLLITAEYDILYVFGEAGRFLHEPDGPATRNLLHKIVPSLRVDLRAVLYEAARDGVTSCSPYVVLAEPSESDPRRLLVQMRVTPLAKTEMPAPAGVLEVVFVVLDVADLPLELPEGSVVGYSPMEEELDRTRSRLSATIEQQETVNEELRVTNEELQSMNEELQSTTEELETSREELQSMNEEMVVVNQELKNKIEEVSQSNVDLSNFIEATRIGAIFLSRTLRVVRYMPQATALYHLTPADTGRPIGSVGNNLLEPSPAEAIAEVVLETGEMVQTEEGGWYVLRGSPYRDESASVLGVVLTFNDVTALKESERQLEVWGAQQRAVAALSLRAIEGADVSRLAEEAASHLARLTGAMLAEVWLPEVKDGEVADARADATLLPARYVRATAPLSYAGLRDRRGYDTRQIDDAEGARDPWLAHVMEATEPILSPDLHQEDRFEVPSYFTEGLEEAGSGLALTVSSSDAALPCIIRLVARGADAFGAAGVIAARSLGSVLIQAWANARATALSESRFRQIEALYAFAPIGVGYVDENYRYQRINDRLAAINGIPAADHMGKTVAELLPDMWSDLESLFDHLYETGEPVEAVEVAGTTPATGDIEHVYEASYYPDLDAEGKACGLSIVVQDITARKRDEQALRRALSQAQAQASEISALYRTAPVGLALIDLDHRVVRMNHHLARISGVEPGEADGRLGRDITPNVSDQVDQYVDTVIATGRPVVDQEIAGEIEGETRTFLCHYYPVLDGNEKPAYVTAVIEDITELKEQQRRAAHDALTQRKQAEELAALYERAPFGVAIIEIVGDEGAELRFGTTNAPFALMLGQSVSDLAGEALDATHDPLSSELGDIVRSVRRRRAAVSQRLIRVNQREQADSEQIFAVDSYPLFVEQDGKRVVRAVSCIVQDVTERERRAAQLGRLTEELETQVRAQTRQLRTLVTDVALAEDEERRRIALVLHDEVQQLLYGAQLKLQVLRPEIDDLARNERSAKFLHDRFDSLEALIEQVLEATRTLNADISPPPLDEGEAFGRLLEWLGSDVERRFGLPVEVVISTTLPNVEPDVQMLLFRLVRELLFNVVKHAEASKATLTLAPEDDRRLRLEVADDGKGFADLASVLDPHGRSRRSGLATARRRLRIIEGDLQIEPVEDGGVRLAVISPYKLNG